MHIDLTGHHVDITDSLRNYVNEKMSRLERHFDHVTNSHVILSVEKLRHRAEATIQLNGSQVFADSTKENMYAHTQERRQARRIHLRKRNAGAISCDLSFHIAQQKPFLSQSHRVPGNDSMLLTSSLDNDLHDSQ